ncbi:hypothetical protein [Xylanibacter caecicola]|uniref:hypothetical protein n=1 Tax=Xylanibacter caecicola TaxID=2736294 RepID=UPI0025873EE4|nr:hypothetical protein [Xylanibacter caecicola]
MKNYLLSITICISATLFINSTISAQTKINLAGIYELNIKKDGGTHQMYLELDFVNNRPDFTQTFTGKTADLKLLPEDFMNAKKLKQRFKGTTAPGFGRYREKYLLSITEEFRITNPHIKKGVVIADWENEMGKTGKVIIIPNEDGSVITYGLTELDRSLSPDGMWLELVKDLTNGNAEKRPADFAKNGTATAGFIENIRTSCGSDFQGTVQRLISMPDDTDNELPNRSSSANKQTPQKDDNEIKIELWGENQPVVFKFHTINTGGDYGKFETNATLDFWQEDNGEISMRQFATTVYFNSGKLNEYEFIYTGRRKGNKIIFTRRQDSLNGGNFTALESWMPSVLTIKSPTSVVFDRCTYIRKK